jgi:hypothetical protein
MKIGVHFNCQCQDIANALRVLLPDAEVVSYARNAPGHDGSLDQTVSALRSCDAVICASDGDRYRAGARFNDSLRAGGCNIFAVPPVIFSGFHPDTISRTAGLREGTTGGYHSRLNIIGFVAGLSVADTLGLFNGIVFRRMNYFDYYRVGEKYLAGCFEKCGVDIAPYLDRWKMTGVFMHGPNHPKVGVTCDLAEIACQMAGLKITGSRHAFDFVPDSLSRHPRHPVFPEIARELGVEGHTSFKPESLSDGTGFRVLTLPEFLARQFAFYRGIKRETLLAADGVESGLEALGLQGRPASFSPDITPSDGSISLSGAWHPLEHWAGDTFRWVSSSGTITLLSVADGTERIEMEVQPGPGIAVLPLQLEIVDETGCQLLKTLPHGREVLTIDVPVRANQKSQLRVLARNGGQSISGDPRVLDFRVFRIDRKHEKTVGPVNVAGVPRVDESLQR